MKPSFTSPETHIHVTLTLYRPIRDKSIVYDYPSVECDTKVYVIYVPRAINGVG